MASDESINIPRNRYRTWSERIFRQLRWRLHWLLPNIIPSPHDGDKAYRDASDDEANEASRLPADEQVRVAIVWGTEVYGPSEVESLYQNLERLRWSSGADRPSNRSLIRWLQHQRAYGQGGSYNVGVVYPSDRPAKELFPINRSELPVGVNYLLVRLFQISPSCTCVLVGFVLDDYSAAAYEEELGRNRRTIFRRILRGVQSLGPEHQKQESLLRIRADLRGKVKAWYKQNLPGFFCDINVDRLPTAELLTSERDCLLAPSQEDIGIHFGWRRLIANASPFDLWTCRDCPSFQFSTEDGDHGDSFHLIATVRLGDIPVQALSYRGGRQRGAVIAYCHETLEGILSNYATVSFLREVARYLKISRGNFGVDRLKSARSTDTLDLIQAFFAKSLGTPAVVSELRKRANHLGLFTHDCELFETTRGVEEDKKVNIAETFRYQTEFLSEQIISDEHSIREHLEQLASVVSVRESVRAQRHMQWLTYAAILLAAASLWIALPPVDQWGPTLRSTVNRSIAPR